MFKKLRYIHSILEVLKISNNWFEMILLFFYPHTTTLKLRNGISFKLNNFHNLIPIREIFIGREYYISKIKPRIIVDIGANIGDSTIFFSRTYPKSKIFAYEPSSKIYSSLQNNLKLNKVENVKPFKLGISSKSGKIKFYENSKSGLSSLYVKSDNNKKSTINVVTLNYIFNKNNIKKCDLLKVDCEGAEYDIILNLDKDILSKIRNMIIEYHEGVNDYNHNDLVKFLIKNKFKIRVKKHKIESNIGIIYAKK